MVTEVVMPKLGLTMERGTIGAWLKEEGEAVERGEPLLEVVTDKVTMEVEAQAAGVLRRILLAAGEEVDVATPIGLIAGEAEDISGWEVAGPAGAAPADHAAPATAPVPTAPDTATTPSPAPTPAAPTAPALATAPGTDGGRPHRASPKARHIAAEHGVDLTRLTGSGPAGRIVSADVEARFAAGAASPTPAAPPTEGRVVELTRPQQIAAERLTASYREAPHIDLEMGVSAVWLQQLRDGYAAEGRQISYNDLLLKAVAAALVDHPRLNAHFVEGRVHERPAVDLGLAVDTPQGLLVPVLRDAARLGLDGLAAESRRLVDAARHGRLGPDDLAAGSFTISNLGMFGVSRFAAIINPPQVAILAVGAIEPTVVPLAGDGMGVRPRLRLTLSADHRAVDGAMAARFLRRLREILESPGLLGR